MPAIVLAIRIQGLLLALAACLPGAAPTPMTETAPFDLLGPSDLEPYADPLEAVTTLRSQWFPARPVDASRAPLLLVDGIPMRRIGALAGIPKYRIVDIRYLSPYEVKTRFAMESNDGAVLVTTKR